MFTTALASARFSRRPPRRSAFMRERVAARTSRLTSRHAWGRLTLATSAAIAGCTVVVLPAVAAESGAHREPVGAITIVEYNILGANHSRGERIGGPLSERTARAARLLARGDLVSTQENMPQQQRLLRGLLQGYSRFPEQTSSVSNVIYFRRDRFELRGSGSFRYPGDGDRGLHVHGGTSWGTYARLNDRTTGLTYFVVDAHFPSRNDAPGSDPGGSLKRELTSHIVRDLVAHDRARHAADVIVVAADTNTKKWLTTHQTRLTPYSNDLALDGNRHRLPDCILTRDPNVLVNVFDLARGKARSCPTASRSNQTDEVLWVYMTPQPGMTYRERRVVSPVERTISDHPPVIVTVSPS